MIDVMSADDALDAVGRGRTLLCFARPVDVDAVRRVIDFYVRTQSTRIITVEPTIEAAQTLQVIRYPTFILYEDGAERWQAVGSAQLAERAHQALR
jgi:hypothetical protein